MVDKIEEKELIDNMIDKEDLRGKLIDDRKERRGDMKKKEE